jgi:preprotein translocase subunit SecY
MNNNPFFFFRKILSINSLRKKIFFTLIMIFVFRIGANISIPGINPIFLEYFYKNYKNNNSILDSYNSIRFYNVFSGGSSIEKLSIFSLGIIPYISSSIIFQLIFSILFNVRKEINNKNKVSRYIKLICILICLIQSIFFIKFLINIRETFENYNKFELFSEKLFSFFIIKNQFLFIMTSSLFLTTGTFILIWIGEQISNNGIGNGVSILIMVNIISGFLNKIKSYYLSYLINKNYCFLTKLKKLIFSYQFYKDGLIIFIISSFIIIFIIFLLKGKRNIPIEYSRGFIQPKFYRNKKIYSSFSLKINYSGISPIIFAHSVLTFPRQLFFWLKNNIKNFDFIQDIILYLSPGNIFYYLIYGFLIVLFSYFWTFTMFNANQISEDLKRQGGYISGVHIGLKTEIFLRFIMNYLTLFGSLFLLFITFFSDILLLFNIIPNSLLIFFEGSGIVILIGVILEIINQIEVYLLENNYQNLLKL